LEVRNIDPKPDNDQNAGRVLGTVIRLVPPARHSPAPNPYRFLIDRALNQNPTRGKTSGPKGFSREQGCLSDSPQRSSAPKKSDERCTIGLRDDAGSHHNAGEAENRLSTSQRLEVDHAVFVGPPATHSNHQNAGNARTDSRNYPFSECQSAPSYPAPNPNEQNAEAAEATYPPSNSLFDKSGISSSSARPAPNSTEPTDLGTGFSRDHGLPPVTRGLSPIRGLRHLLSRFLDVVMEHSAFSDPSREMTNFGWRKRA